MKAIRCHNRRRRKFDGVVKEQAVCGGRIGFVDESVNHSDIKYCSACGTYIKITIKDKEYTQENIDKGELNFNDFLNPKIGKTQVKFPGEGRRLWQDPGKRD